jgi:hypothetical protein
MQRLQLAAGCDRDAECMRKGCTAQLREIGRMNNRVNGIGHNKTPQPTWRISSTTLKAQALPTALIYRNGPDVGGLYPTADTGRECDSHFNPNKRTIMDALSRTR